MKWRRRHRAISMFSTSSNKKKMDSKEKKEVLKLGGWEDGKRGNKLQMINVNHNPITQITQIF